ncbi:MAG: hypothetical protein JSV04_13590, partial [Candidatus Heimdallarchaeota archaeon]
KQVTENLITALQTDDSTRIINLLYENRVLFEELSSACSCHLEIKAHQTMSNIAAKYGAVAKFSGAGGGDCSVGVCFDKNKATRIITEWEQHDIMPIDIKMSKEGIRLE